MKLTGSVLLLVAALHATAAAQRTWKNVVDAGLSQLRSTQEANGSYANDPTATAKALLAYRSSHRRYGPTDGPFVRNALAWLQDHPLPANATATALLQALVEEYQDVAGPGVLNQWRDQLATRGDANEGTPPGTTQELPRLLETLLEPPAKYEAVIQLAARYGQEPAALDGRHWTTVFQQAVFPEGPSPFVFHGKTATEIADLCRLASLLKAHSPPETGASDPPVGLTGTPRQPPQELKADYRAAAGAALAFLESQQENGRFGFQGHADPGITAMALTAVLSTCRTLSLEIPGYVDSGLDWLKNMQHEDGSIHQGTLKVYVTSAAVMALAERNRPEDQEALEQASRYLKVVQSDEGEGYESSTDWAYGGIGYGGDLRPDLSNTQFGLEALRTAGVQGDDEAFQRAIVFLERCQNNPEVNTGTVERGDGKIVKAGSDGGGVYRPGDSKAGLIELDNGTFVARSYGSMSYALLKCYLFAGVSMDDPRVQTLLDWIQQNYTLEYNPGFDRELHPGSEYQGLYYYYFTMAKALDASGLEVLRDADGNRHAWRSELLAHLLESGFREGFWSNQRSPRWWEELPVLATSYSLIAMSYCLNE